MNTDAPIREQSRIRALEKKCREVFGRLSDVYAMCGRLEPAELPLYSMRIRGSLEELRQLKQRLESSVGGEDPADPVTGMWVTQTVGVLTIEENNLGELLERVELAGRTREQVRLAGRISDLKDFGDRLRREMDRRGPDPGEAE